MEITIGTRGSKLALYQAEKVAEELKKIGIESKIKIIKTTGDKVQNKKISDIGIGVFTKELDIALLNNNIDIAVHSLKDIPTIWNKNLDYVVLKRDGYKDLLIYREIKDNLTIGTSSIRRRAFLKLIYPNAKFKLLRGNVDTRLKKLKSGEYDAIVLSEVSIKRLNIELDFDYIPLPILPAPAQGVIAIAYKKDNQTIKNILQKINHKKTYLECLAERTALNVFGSGCSVPFGAYGEYRDGYLHLKVGVANDEYKELEDKIKCSLDDINKAKELGRRLGEMLRE